MSDWLERLKSDLKSPFHGEVIVALKDLRSAIAEIERLRANYHDLLFQVQTKRPDETRHETARRIIQQWEAPPSTQAAALSMEDKSE